MSHPCRNALSVLAMACTLALAACSPSTPDAPVADAAPPAAVTDPAPPAAEPVAGENAVAACNAEAVQALVGQASSDAIVEQARNDSGSSSVRVLKPGDAATMDYRQDRLNIDLDDAGVIQALRCG